MEWYDFAKKIIKKLTERNLFLDVEIYYIYTHKYEKYEYNFMFNQAEDGYEKSIAIRAKNKEGKIFFHSTQDISDRGVDIIINKFNSDVYCASMELWNSPSYCSSVQVQTFDIGINDETFEDKYTRIRETLYYYMDNIDIKNVFTKYAQVLGKTAIMTAHGFNNIYDWSQYRLTFSVVGLNKREYHNSIFSRKYSNLDLSSILDDMLISLTAEELKRAKKPKVDRIFFTSFSAVQLITEIAMSETYFSEIPINAKIANSNLYVEDNGLIDMGIGSRPFDDAGFIQAQRSIIKKGIYKGYSIYNKFYNVENVNVSRDSYKDYPKPALSNLIIVPSSIEIKKFILNSITIYEIEDMQFISDESLLLKGVKFVYVNSLNRKYYGKRGIILSISKLLQCFKNAGNNLTFHSSTTGAPTLEFSSELFDDWEK